MKRKIIDPKQQFSKWLARYGAIFWGIYLLVIAALIYFRPEAAMACVYLTLVVTANKALDTVAYTHNSTTEKIILGALERTKVELSLKGTATNPSTAANDNNEDFEEEGEENG